MASRRAQVSAAVEALVKAAYPAADIRRNTGKPVRIDPNGLVIVHDGDPGEPEVLLSPLSYTYDHEIPLAIAAYERGTQTAAEALDEILEALGAAIEADRTLGGLCEWVDAKAPDADDGETGGAEPFTWAELALVCTYTTRNPLA